MSDHYTPIKRAYAVQVFFETKSFQQTKALYCQQFNIDSRDKRQIHNSKSIRRWVRDFKQFGTVEDKNQKSKARPT